MDLSQRLIVLAGVKTCHPQCRDFKCSKNALRIHGRTYWCDWANDKCDIANCNYAMCYKRQLLDNGVCGMSIKRKTKEEYGPEDIFPEQLRVKGKVMRKTGEKWIF